MGYIPVIGEEFKRFGRTVRFVEIDPTIHYIYSSNMSEDGWKNIKTPADDQGVIYTNEKGQKMSCYPMSHLEKEVTYEINFK